MLTLGLDDAGRGPVIGPMVIAGVLIEESEILKLKALKVKDSKLHTKKQRENLFEQIIKTVKGYKIIKIYPKEIDFALNSPDLNLNKLEALKFAEIINYLKPDKAIIDCPSPNINSYKEFLESHLTVKTNLIVEHKADLNHVIVAAASILAKYTRDKEVEEIEKKYGPIGSGYMSNPICQEFTKNNWEKHPEIFRHSWTPYKNHKNNKHQKSLQDF